MNPGKSDVIGRLLAAPQLAVPSTESRSSLRHITPPRRTLVASVALGLLTLIAFLPAVRAGFIWDDDYYVTQNLWLHSAAGLLRIWTVLGAVPQYYPVTHTSFWLEYHLWQLNSIGYHLDNILLHAFNAILLYGILRRLNAPAAWLVAAVFAIHPMQVESVAWVTERKNVLSTFFFLLALRTYLSYAWPEFSTASDTSAKRQPWKYAVSLTLFILALLSKSVTGSLPAVVLILTWWKRGRLTRRDVVPLLPFFVLAIAMGSLTGWMERHIVGAVGPDFDFAPWQRLVIAGRALCFYTAKFLFPLPLMFIYPRWSLQPSAWPWLMLFPIGIVIALISLWILRRRLGRGPFAAALLFVIMLFPALGFVNVYPMRFSFVADHFQYLASIALSALIAGVAARTLAQSLKPTVAAIVLLTLSVFTWHRAKAFHDARTLWLDTLAKNPTCWVAHLNIASELQEDGDDAADERQYARSLQYYPAGFDAMCGLGRVSQHRHDYAAAQAWFARALATIPDSSPPELLKERSRAWVDLANLDEDKAAENLNSPDFANSIVAYQQALISFPEYEPALLGLGHLLTEQGKLNEVIALYNRALLNGSESIAVRYNLGNALYAKHDWDAAAAQFRKVVQFEPNSEMAYNNLGSVYGAQHRWDDAITQFRAALSIDPSFDFAARNLNNALLQRTNEQISAGKN